MTDDYSLKSYSYHLPDENIAQTPADKRDRSRLMVLDTTSSDIRHGTFIDILGYFRKGDVLVVNDTRVFPARLFGRKVTGGKVEVFLLNYPEQQGEGVAAALALLKSSKRPATGAEITISNRLKATVNEYLSDGKAQVVLSFDPADSLAELLQESGQVPLPPYISRENGTTDSDRERYQTVYADSPGAVAAPTAGLHFTDEILERVRQAGVSLATVTLHVGYGTFAPVRHEIITDHSIHREFISVSEETVKIIEQARQQGGRVWAVGTTSVRALEYCGREGSLKSTQGWCDLYIYPGFDFKVVDNLITNFHLPESSLLFLVSALCGREKLLHCYNLAIEEGYRFYSYGDAMAVITKP